jgi:hypothetical protein
LRDEIRTTKNSEDNKEIKHLSVNQT